MSDSYDPKAYWSERLDDEFSLKGVGHLSFSAGYNDWLYRAKADALAEALSGTPRGSRALDVGSGIGWVVGQLVDRGFAVEGCDIAESAVARLADRYPQSTFFTAAIGSDPLPRGDDTYDVITMLDVAYHITDDALFTRAVRELGRLLKPGGRLVITDRLDPLPFEMKKHVKFRSQADWGAAGGPVGLRFTRVEHLYTWLSREQEISKWQRLPDELRGRIEYALDRRLPIKPHLRWAALTK